MSQKRKNLVLLIILIALSVLTGIVYISGGEQNMVEVSEDKFSLELNTVITTVKLKSKSDNIIFEYIDGSWFINDQYKLDQGMRDIFFAVLSSVEIKRPVPGEIEDSVKNFLLENGIKVEILNNETLIRRYLVEGDDKSQTTYFMDPEEGRPYIMTIPGYKSYIAGIFEVPVNDWRSRFIFDINWSSLQRLGITYPNERGKNFELVYKDNFFELKEGETIDSAAVFDYISTLSDFQVYRYLNTGYDQTYDSIVNTTPEAIIEIKNIGDDLKILQIFPSLKNKKMQTGILNREQMMLISEDQIKKVLITAKELGGQ